MARKVFIAILALSALAFTLLVFSLNALVEKNRDSIRINLEKHLGRSLTFDNLHLDLRGRLALSANNLRIAEDPYFAATPFIQSKELTMPLRLLPLLWGKIVVKKFILYEPEIQLIKNESGDLNILARSWPIGEGDRSLLAPGLEVTNGTVYYIDRSVEEPLELRIGNLEMDLKGPGLTGTSTVYIGANLLALHGQNVSVEGRIGPFGANRAWNQYPLDLQVEFDPVPFPQLARILPYLKEMVPAYLDITGPLAFRARIQGTSEQPRIENLTLRGPFFGSTKINTVVNGNLDFSKSGSWKDSEMKLSTTVGPVTLDRLKNMPFLRQLLPTAFTSKGPLSVETKLQGSLEELKIHTLVEAEESEIVYGGWLKKAAGIPAQMELMAKVQKERVLFDESTLTFNNMKLKFSGSLDKSPERRLMLNLQLKDLELSGWDRLLLPLSSYRTDGNLQLDLSIHKEIGLPHKNMDIRGDLHLADVRVEDRKTGQVVDKIKARVSFAGYEARIENLSLRSGTSDLTSEAVLPDLSKPILYYTMHSPQLSPRDLTDIAGYTEDRIKGLLSRGEVRIQEGEPTLQGEFSSPEGTLQEISYRDMRGEITWSPKGLNLKDLSFQAHDGAFRINGAWGPDTEIPQPFTLHSDIEAVDLESFSNQIFPGFKNSVEGRLSYKSRILGERKNGSAVPESLRGGGEARIREGSLKDFNLVKSVLSGVGGLPTISKLLSPKASTRLNSILQQRDTPFDTLVATFTVEKGRFHTEDLLLSTSDYDINGEGWVGFDKTTKWDADLILSPEITEILLHENKNIRYLLDRNGRLTIPLRVEGVLPNIQTKPNLRRLARTIQRGLLRRQKTSPPEKTATEKKKRR
jgi:hypothetical protein